MKRPPKISAKQLALSGVDLGPPPPPPKRKPAPHEKRKRWGRYSLPGPVVPLPTDDRGRELAIGPFRVLQRVDGPHVLLDYRKKLGTGDVVIGSKRTCVVEMVRRAKAEKIL